MRITVLHNDEQLAKLVRVQLHDLCRELERRHDQADCHISLKFGVVVFELWAADGVKAMQPIGVTALAVVQPQPAKLRALVDLLLRRCKEQQARARLARFAQWTPASLSFI